MKSINLQHLQKKFRSIHALNDITTTISAGHCMALIGPNGCGKTTLLKSVLGLVIPDSGKIFVNDKEIFNRSDYRNDIGYMPQIARYPDHMTVKEVFELIKTIRNANEPIDYELFERYDLSKISNQYMYTLSGGTRQKISAALAFLFDPSILILDEPTSGLDPHSSELLKEKIINSKTLGKMVIITSHILSDLDELCTDIMYMQDGKLVFNKKIRQLQAETNETKISKMLTIGMSAKSVSIL